MTVPASTPDLRPEPVDEATGEGGLDRRVVAAQYFAEVSQYIFDNPHLFARQPEDGVADEAEPPLTLVWSRIAESRVVLWTFLLCFLLPIAAGVTYFVGIASPRYATDVQMTLRSRNGAMSINAGMLDIVSGSASYFANPDTYLVADYLLSREAVELVSQSVDLRRVWGRAEVDPLSRLAPDASIEDLVAVWRRYVRIGVDALANTVQIEVQAFEPDDAGRIGEALARSAETIINALTERVRFDSVRFSEAQVKAAEVALAAAREEVRAFRNRIESVAPDKVAAATLNTATDLMQKKLRLERDIAMRRRSLVDDSPVIRRLQTDLDTVEGQIAEINRKAIADPVLAARGDAAATTFSAQFLEYDELLTSQMFAEKVYSISLDMLESARQSAQRQQMYVTPFVRPGLAKEARYPRRVRAIGIVVGLSFLFWLSSMLVVAVVREDLNDEG